MARCLFCGRSDGFQTQVHGSMMHPACKRQFGELFDVDKRTLHHALGVILNEGSYWIQPRNEPSERLVRRVRRALREVQEVPA